VILLYIKEIYDKVDFNVKQCLKRFFSDDFDTDKIIDIKYYGHYLPVQMDKTFNLLYGIFNGVLPENKFDHKRSSVTLHQDGRSTIYNYNDKDNILECISPYGSKTTHIYNQHDILIESTSPSGFHLYDYNSKGQLVSELTSDNNHNKSIYTNYIYENDLCVEVVRKGYSPIYRYKFKKNNLKNIYILDDDFPGGERSILKIKYKD
jgi:YD repeat-containing protein